MLSSFLAHTMQGLHPGFIFFPAPLAELLTIGPDHVLLAPSGGRHLAKVSSDVLRGALGVSQGHCHKVPQAGRVKREI